MRTVRHGEPWDASRASSLEPAVREAGVIGVPDEYRGETVKAIVSLRAGKTVEPEELVSFCRERMAAYKYPRIAVNATLIRRALRTGDRPGPMNTSPATPPEPASAPPGSWPLWASQVINSPGVPRRPATNGRCACTSGGTVRCPPGVGLGYQFRGVAAEAEMAQERVRVRDHRELVIHHRPVPGSGR